MERENDRGKSFTRRALLVGALQGAFLSVLGGRLAWLQLSQGPRYKTLAENNRINIKMLAPSRGQIVDRFGMKLATNGQNFRTLVIPEQTKNLETALSRLQKLISLSQNDIQNVLIRSQKAPSFVPLEIKDNLTWDDVSTIEVNLPDLPGIFIDEGEIRSYPLEHSTAHIVGYVGAVNKSELTGDPVLTLPGFRIGKTGLEKAYDKELRGTAGTSEIEVNVVGREVRELRRNPGQPGRDVKLTIDSGLQTFVQKRLSRTKSASAVVMDVTTGEVYALVSSPAFDPNLFTKTLSAETWEEMLANPGLPLNNKAVGGQYPPGSTFKMVTALAALEEKVITRNSSYVCPGHYDYGEERFHCWKRGGHGRVDVVEALAESCDTFFYNIATELGVDRLARYAEKLGLGHKLDFELTEERPGLMPTQSWKMGRFGENWQPGESIVASIGQGYILSTPLQLAVMTARLVNGGYTVKPWITGFIGDEPGYDAPLLRLNFKKRNIDLVLRGMERVVNHQKGTAYESRIEPSAWAMGGKTGTAQVRRITKEDRLEGVRNEDLPWKFRHHALFVGYAPLKNPRYACCVVVDHGGGGASAAAPIAKDIMIETQRRAPAKTPLILNEKEREKIVTPTHKPSFMSREG